MKIRLSFCVAVILTLGAYAQSASPTARTDDVAIRDACAALAQNARDAKALSVIQSVAVNDTMPADMRSRAMVFLALPFLQQMNTNQFARMAQVITSTFPEEGPVALGVSESDWLATCPSCNGAGGKTMTCTVCRADGTCGRCNGTKKINVACLECKGTGKVVVISPNVARRSESVLTELRTLAMENIQFAEQSKKALAVRTAPERIAALDEVMAAFPKRQDLTPLIKAREVAQKEIADKAVRDQAQEERNRMLKEKDAILAVVESLPFSSIPVLLRQIDAFLEQYPKSEYRIEIEVLRSKQQSRYTFYTNLWRALYVLGGLIVVMFVVQMVKDLIFNRKKKEGMLKLPGRENAGDDNLADPLSDSRKAAAAREAEDELGIYP